MPDSHRYAMLLTSLPDHGPLFGARQPPLSRLRLDERLRLLDEEDARTLSELRALLEWAAQDPHASDVQLIAQARARLPGIHNTFARELVSWRLELRTLICALRRRARGLDAPSGRHWGYGRWLAHLQRHWNEPAFRLERAWPWLPEAARLLEREDVLGLERLLLGAVWTHLERASEGHVFDVEAVLIYVLRWDLIDRWTRYERDQALARFDALSAAALEAGPEWIRHAVC